MCLVEFPRRIAHNTQTHIHILIEIALAVIWISVKRPCNIMSLVPLMNHFHVVTDVIGIYLHHLSFSGKQPKHTFSCFSVEFNTSEIHTFKLIVGYQSSNSIWNWINSNNEDPLYLTISYSWPVAARYFINIPFTANSVVIHNDRYICLTRWLDPEVWI